ncbi:lysosomal alpha-glucosidase [Nilaparvata lugens]|uniref:lysosomal alpha-glucosidase n=1 Tax=Nilaparvata lugens TaxID=108931 RepID=UPI00193E1A9B|nr:lysosomal alpha-glucosidase [Nilaparvata lugens]
MHVDNMSIIIVEEVVDKPKKLNGLERLIIFIGSLFIIFLSIKLFLNNYDKSFKCEWKLKNGAIKAMMSNKNVQPPAPTVAQCSVINDTNRFDCFPRGNASEKSCSLRGCCWMVPKNVSFSKNIPYCFYPENYSLYEFLNESSTDFGVTGYLNNSFSSPYPSDISLLKLDVKFETENRLNIKFYDPKKKRYEPPIPEVAVLDTAAKNTKYTVNINKKLPGFNVMRKCTDKVLFQTTSAGFTFADQFLQLTAFLPTDNIYGLGVHRNNFVLNNDWNNIPLFNSDLPPADNTNLYSSHPFFMAIEDDGSSFGVLLLNSNAMDIIVQPAPAITYRAIGGIFNFYFFLGPTPLQVIEQYTELVGRPIMPPYWSLGFHLCRFGYQNLDDAKNILKKNLDAGITVHVARRFYKRDINFWVGYNELIFLLNFVMTFFSQFLQEGRHFVMIMDPGVSASEPKGTYPPYDDAIKMDVLVKDHTGKHPIIGKVWNPNSTVFPDFTHPNAAKYWLKQLQALYDNQFQFDGLWIDMNEPSNFVDGSQSGCPASSLVEDPPYVPRIHGGILRSRTLCMTAKHAWGRHYDLHNLHGMTEAIATSFALAEVREKRPFVISRSSFIGQGHYSGVWTGDVFSTWDDLYHSIPDMLTYNILGIPMVGADICGFNGNTTVALCQRWGQLGAFYPFSRNHNEDQAIGQDPASLGPDVVNSFKKAFTVRYTLLPYLYTLFWQAHDKGHPVARPLFFEFPNDKATFRINKQFMWGSAIHIIPVLEEGMTYVKGYFPQCRWFNYYNGVELVNHGPEVSISAPMDTIPVFIKGGNIIPTQEPNDTIALSRKNDFGLLVVPNEKGESFGTLFWDDGESIGTYEKGEYVLINFTLKGSTIESKVLSKCKLSNMKLGSASVLGVGATVNNVTVNKKSFDNFMYYPKEKHMELRHLNLDLQEPFEISWT